MNDHFWKRQFRQFIEPVTEGQVAFDFIFGLVLPILCLVFDPFIFRSFFDIYENIGGASEYQVFVYTAVAIGCLTLGCWLFLDHKYVARLSGLLAGIFFAGFLFAGGFAIFLLPYSITGLFCLLGVFGFIPFVTAYVFLRNGVRALRRAKQKNSWLKVSQFTLIGIFLGFGIPALLHWQAGQYVANSVNEIVQGDDASVKSAAQGLKNFAGIFPQFTRKQLTYNPTLLASITHLVEAENQATDDLEQRLKYLSWCKMCFDRLPCLYRGAYSQTPSLEKKQILAKVYQVIMEEKIDERVGIVSGHGPDGGNFCY